MAAPTLLGSKAYNSGTYATKLNSSGDAINFGSGAGRWCQVVVITNNNAINVDGVTVGGTAMTAETQVDTPVGVNGKGRAFTLIGDGAGGVPTGTATVEATVSSGAGYIQMVVTWGEGASTLGAATHPGAIANANPTWNVPSTTSSDLCIVSGFLTAQTVAGGAVHIAPYVGIAAASGSTLGVTQFGSVIGFIHAFSLNEVGAATSTTLGLAITSAQYTPASGGWAFKVTGVADTTDPVLSTPTGAATGATTGTGTISTDTAEGTLYAVVTTSATAPSKAQVKAGQNNGGGAAAWNGSQSISSTGTKTLSATGLTAANAYYFHFMHEDVATNQSTVASSASFTTASLAPTINTQPTAQAVNEGSTATYTVSATASGGSLTYQWKRQPPGGGAFSNVGTNSASYTTGSLDCATDHGANFKCTATDDNGPTDTDTVGLTVRAVTTTVRPSSDITTTGWSASTGTDFFALIDETTASDTDYITSPTVSGTPEPIKFGLKYPWATGTRRIRFNAKGNGGTPTMRVKLLNDADTVVGTSADQVVTTSWASYDLEIVLSGPATRGTIEFVS